MGVQSTLVKVESKVEDNVEDKQTTLSIKRFPSCLEMKKGIK